MNLLSAWIAGNGDGVTQAFDVWLAFEFPPLIARSVRADAAALKDGVFELCREHRRLKRVSDTLRRICCVCATDRLLCVSWKVCERVDVIALLFRVSSRFFGRNVAASVLKVCGLERRSNNKCGAVSMRLSCDIYESVEMPDAERRSHVYNVESY